MNYFVPRKSALELRRCRSTATARFEFQLRVDRGVQRARQRGFAGREAIPGHFQALSAPLTNELEAPRAERHDEWLSVD